MPRRSPSTGEALIRRYWESYQPYDPGKLRRLRQKDWTLEWPQSGERVPSHEDDRAIHERYPGYPSLALERLEGGRAEEWALSPQMPVKISGSADLWVTENLLEYPSGERYHEISILELRGDRIARQTDYFAEPFSPPAWRELWVERIEEDQAAAGRQVRGTGNDERAHRAALERYVQRFGSGERAEAVEDLMHPDAVVDWPQSGERIRGLANYVAIVKHHPTPPDAGLRRIVGAGDFFVLELSLDYAGTLFYEVACLEFQGDRVARLTAYFAAPFDAPDWRAQWTQRTIPERR